MKTKELLKRLREIHKVVEGCWENPSREKTDKIMEWTENELATWIEELEATECKSARG